MQKDLWHYARTKLAQQVVNMFDIGLSSALTFFAPRRMGKTEFLRKDILPYAQKNKWAVHYFSFLESNGNSQTLYTRSILEFAINNGSIKNQSGIMGRVKKIGGQAGALKAEAELSSQTNLELNLQAIIDKLGQHKKTILLLDEVQSLANNQHNNPFVASLRTALDTNKDRVKAIFTGSSREGLRQMFSKANAPFFHYGQNLDFPPLTKAFTDHLADVYRQATTRTLDQETLWQAFQQMDLVPQLIRALVENLALNPNLSIDTAKQQLLADLYNDRAYIEAWQDLSRLEQLLLVNIAPGKTPLFARDTRQQLAKQLGIEELKASTVQSAMRVLDRKGLIIKSSSESRHIIEDPNFKSWLEKVDGAS
ncbi:MAG: hypothetical protein P1U34_02930 [Coxiellaceae bacterium]|nr:hypothetical protein [Coxiellaceae bacterium]